MSEPRRIYSIDIFRGITIALMVIVNNPGSWSNVYPPLLHAKWHGCTPTDLVFPFFLFLVGASMRFAFVKWHYYPSIEFYKHVFWRTFSIFMAGILLSAYPFIRQDWDWSTFRILGVLQRIALAYGISACLIIRYDFKQMVKILTGLLIFYWGLLWIGGTEDPYGLETIAYKGHEDPPEIMSFIRQYINPNKLYKQALHKKIMMFYEALGWDEPTDATKTMERFF